jgi:hypothetical protein
MAQRTITFNVSRPRVGLWCNTCALPSAWEFDVLRIKDSGVSLVSTFRRCTDCDNR